MQLSSSTFKQVFVLLSRHLTQSEEWIERNVSDHLREQVARLVAELYTILTWSASSRTTSMEKEHTFVPIANR